MWRCLILTVLEVHEMTTKIVTDNREYVTYRVTDSVTNNVTDVTHRD